jgi:hypothetical protein
MIIFLFFLLLVFWCILFAKLEAEIEGPNGWVKELPTAKYIWDEKERKMFYKAFASNKYILVDHEKWPGNFYFFYIHKLLGGKDFTTYHRIVDFIQLFVSHILVYLCFWPESVIVLEIRAVASLMLIWSLEDNLWFDINPCASQSEHHKDWIMIGNYRVSEKGMFLNFIFGLILLLLSFFLTDFWHWII